MTLRVQKVPTAGRRFPWQARAQIPAWTIFGVSPRTSVLKKKKANQSLIALSSHAAN